MGGEPAVGGLEGIAATKEREIHPVSVSTNIFLAETNADYEQITQDNERDPADVSGTGRPGIFIIFVCLYSSATLPEQEVGLLK
jgi:hypothetical protein